MAIGQQTATLYQLSEQYEKLITDRDTSIQPVQMSLAKVTEKLANLQIESEKLTKQINFKQTSLKQQLAGTEANRVEKERLETHLNTTTTQEADEVQTKGNAFAEHKRIMDGLTDIV